MHGADCWQGWKGCFAFGVMSVGMMTLAAAPKPPQSPKVSTFASAERLAEEAQGILTATEQALADKATYKEQAGQVTRDANTLAVLSLALGLHDMDNPLKAAAPALIPAAGKLAAAEDYDAAKVAWGEVQAAAKSKAGTEKLQWHNAGGMAPLMKQSALQYSKLKRGTAGARFKARANENARSAAVLAVIAQSVLHDDSYGDDAADQELWRKFCVEWRDAAAELGSSIAGGNADSAATALTRLDKSCTECHAAFKVVIKP